MEPKFVQQQAVRDLASAPPSHRQGSQTATSSSVPFASSFPPAVKTPAACERGTYAAACGLAQEEP